MKKKRKAAFPLNVVNCLLAISQGETKDETLKNIKEAIELVLEVIHEDAKILGRDAEISAVEVSA